MAAAAHEPVPPTGRRTVRWLGGLILAVALALRLPTLFAGRPYLNYVDEAMVLHRVVNLLHQLPKGGWDPGWYIYPALSNYAIAGAAVLYSPLYRHLHG